jgi:septal ring factor EnvC (AmiA/AmiB activator)
VLHGAEAAGADFEMNEIPMGEARSGSAGTPASALGASSRSGGVSIKQDNDLKDHVAMLRKALATVSKNTRMLENTVQVLNKDNAELNLEVAALRESEVEAEHIVPLGGAALMRRTKRRLSEKGTKAVFLRA